MNDLLSRVRSGVDALGLPGVTGIALLATAVGLWGSLIVPARGERELLSIEAAKLERRSRGDAAAAGAKTAPEQLATFYAFFPGSGSTPEWLAKIHAAAAARGLQLASAEYKLTRGESSRLARYQITLPVQGTYPQIRAFVGSVLEQVPAAVVDEVSLKRDSVESGRLEARIRITLYLAVPRGGEQGA